MDFVLTLHSHLPYVLNHGRWPHGSDWLSEAAVDTYLPLLEALLGLETAGVEAPVTLGITPVLANQLASPIFVTELEDYLEHRLAACDAAPASLAATGDANLVPLAHYWRERFGRLRDVFRHANTDLITAFRGLEQRGRIEIISSAATHGFLPLLGRDESIRFQLAVGRAEHQRLFGRQPTGCWLPECAFRPGGPWTPKGTRPQLWRRGTDEHLQAAGYRYFFVDAHLPGAGRFLSYDDEFFVGAGHGDPDIGEALMTPRRDPHRSPYRAYLMPRQRGRASLAALVRDPASTLRVWSRRLGYPGDPGYLEFHKIRWPEGLKLWRVTGGDVDLGGKQPYQTDAARGRAHQHAGHFRGVLAGIEAGAPDGDVIVAPFDTELFGHWWFEGIDFLGDLYRALAGGRVCPATARDHMAAHPARVPARLSEGSWGANGDFSMWLNDRTAWTWRRMWPLEDAFWGVARKALAAGPRQREVLAQAARSLLLAQASDWQFIISTGAATDYAERRFALHCDDAEELVAALRPDAAPGALEAAGGKLAALRARDDLFPDVLEPLAGALG